MKRRLFISSAFALASLGCSIIKAQPATELPSGTVSGVVTGPSGPISGAAVTVSPSDNSYHATASDAQGFYALSGLLAGPASLTIAAPGYRDFTATITIVGDGTVTVNVSLTPS